MTFDESLQESEHEMVSNFVNLQNTNQIQAHHFYFLRMNMWIYIIIITFITILACMLAQK